MFTLALALAMAFGGSLPAAVARPSCQDPGGPVAALWNDAQRTAITEAFAATKLSHASRSSGRVVTATDACVQRWTAAQRDTCEATWVRGEQSGQRLDASMVCLEDARRRLTRASGVTARAPSKHRGQSGPPRARSRPDAALDRPDAASSQRAQLGPRRRARCTSSLRQPPCRGS